MPLSYFAPVLGAIPLLAVKASGTVITSSTPANDSELAITLTSGTWQVTLNATTTGAGTNPAAAFNLNYTGTASSNGALTAYAGITGGMSTTGSSAFYASATPIGSGFGQIQQNTSAAALFASATVVVTTGGTLALRYSLSQGTSVTVNAGSSLTAVKVA